MCCDSTYLNMLRREAAARRGQPVRDSSRACHCDCLVVRAVAIKDAVTIAAGAARGEKAVAALMN